MESQGQSDLNHLHPLREVLLGMEEYSKRGLCVWILIVPLRARKTIPLK